MIEPTKEELALLYGYKLDENNQIVSPYGTILKPFAIGKVVNGKRRRAFKVCPPKDVANVQPFLVYVSRFIWTVKNGPIPEETRLFFNDGDVENTAIENLIAG